MCCPMLCCAAAGTTPSASQPEGRINVRFRRLEPEEDRSLATCNIGEEPDPADRPVWPTRLPSQLSLVFALNVGCALTNQLEGCVGHAGWDTHAASHAVVCYVFGCVPLCCLFADCPSTSCAPLCVSFSLTVPQLLVPFCVAFPLTASLNLLCPAALCIVCCSCDGVL